MPTCKCGKEISSGTGIGQSLPEDQWKDKSQPRPIKIDPMCVNCQGKHVAAYMEGLRPAIEQGSAIGEGAL